MTSNTQVPVLLLTGYLGSGKTTLLNNILTNRRGIRFAVIVNDIGEVNIDASLIAKGGVVGQDKAADNTDLVALQNGCICCSLKMDLVEQLASLVESRSFDYIVIEASGICEPAPIAQTICSIPNMESKYRKAGIPRLDAIATVVDALRMRDELGCGESLREHHHSDDIENLVIEQIEFCNIILLNKISEISAGEAARVRAVIRAIQPKARIIECDYCNVDLDCLLNTSLFDFEDVATSATWVQEIENRHSHEDHDHHEHNHQEHHHEHGADCHCGHCHHGENGHTEEYGIGTFVYSDRRPLDINRFDHFIAGSWPESVIRCKGVVYFKHNPDMSYLLETAGRQKKLTEAGLWFATAPEEELRDIMAADPAIALDWDPVYGDRMVKLVFIGKDMDRHAICEALSSCQTSLDKSLL